MLAEDRQCLQPMPRYTPDISKKVFPAVSRYATVLFETNLYSVPCRYVGKSTTVKAYPNHIEVWIAGTLVARHDRLFGRREESLDLHHYLPILAQKGSAIRYARPVQNAVPAEFLNWLEPHARLVYFLANEPFRDGLKWYTFWRILAYFT